MHRTLGWASRSVERYQRIVEEKGAPEDSAHLMWGQQKRAAINEAKALWVGDINSATSDVFCLLGLGVSVVSLSETHNLR